MDLIVLFIILVFSLYGNVVGQVTCAPTWYVLLVAWLRSTVHLTHLQGPMWRKRLHWPGLLCQWRDVFYCKLLLLSVHPSH